VRQWVLSFPKRLRYFLQRDAQLAGRTLQVFRHLRAASFESLRTCFGSALNHHLHFHCCLIDGVFAAEGDGMRFFEATQLDAGMVTTVQEAERGRVPGARGGIEGDLREGSPIPPSPNPTKPGKANHQSIWLL
jgi:hypothetical protein